MKKGKGRAVSQQRRSNSEIICAASQRVRGSNRIIKESYEEYCDICHYKDDSIFIGKGYVNVNDLLKVELFDNSINVLPFLLSFYCNTLKTGDCTVLRKYGMENISTLFKPNNVFVQLSGIDTTKEEYEDLLLGECLLVSNYDETHKKDVDSTLFVDLCILYSAIRQNKSGLIACIINYMGSLISQRDIQISKDLKEKNMEESLEITSKLKVDDSLSIAIAVSEIWFEQITIKYLGNRFRDEFLWVEGDLLNMFKVRSKFKQYFDGKIKAREVVDDRLTVRKTKPCDFMIEVAYSLFRNVSYVDKNIKELYESNTLIHIMNSSNVGVESVLENFGQLMHQRNSITGKKVLEGYKHTSEELEKIKGEVVSLGNKNNDQDKEIKRLERDVIKSKNIYDTTKKELEDLKLKKNAVAKSIENRVKEEMDTVVKELNLLKEKEAELVEELRIKNGLVASLNKKLNRIKKCLDDDYMDRVESLENSDICEEGQSKEEYVDEPIEDMNNLETQVKTLEGFKIALVGGYKGLEKRLEGFGLDIVHIADIGDCKKNPKYDIAVISTLFSSHTLGYMVENLTKKNHALEVPYNGTNAELLVNAVCNAVYK